MAKEVKKTSTDLILEVMDDLKAAQLEAAKCDAGNKASGLRLRKIIAEIPKKLKLVKAISLGK